MEKQKEAQPFLKQVSDYLLQSGSGDFSETAVVFPNRRAGLYFRRHLAASISKPVWAPTVFSIEDFILALTGKTTAGEEQLLLSLYHVYSEAEGKHARDLNDFLSWGPVLLRDFNDIDSYLADPAEVFSYLSEARALSLWSPDRKKLTEFQQSYLHFYQSLIHYYEGLKRKMETLDCYSTGYLYRNAATMISGLIPDLPWKKILFAGFNAITKAEDKIITTLKSAGMAEILWDADVYYLDNPMQEAGQFLREIRNRPGSGDFKWTGDYYHEIPKDIRVIGVPLHIGQAKLAGQILEQLDPSFIEETALVLGDENMLIPVLHSIPESYSEFNVTMGLPLQHTSLYSLLDSYLLAYNRAGRHTRQGETSVTSRFYYKDLLMFFRHPWLIKLLNENHRLAGKSETLLKDGLLEREGMLLSQRFCTRDELLLRIIQPGPHDVFPLDVLFPELYPSVSEIILLSERLLQYLKQLFTGEDQELTLSSRQNIDLEYIYTFSQIFSQLRESWLDTPLVVDIPGFHNLFRQASARSKLSFYGEPLKGLQIMGMLETRNLDFRNIIMLHVNDDILPAAKQHASFIPLDIRMHFRLPAYRENQAVYAYHFYRLLQRAEKVFLIYNTEPGELAGGGKSRYILQMQHELPGSGYPVTIQESVLTFPVSAGQAIQPISLPKTEAVMKKLHEKNEKGWSASSLNKYRSCALKFYFSDIAGIEELTEAEESMDAALLGIAFHSTLEQLFRKHCGKTLTAGVYDEMLSRLPGLLPGVFADTAAGGDISSGKNYLLVEIASAIITKYLEAEKKEIESKPEMIQKRLNLFLEKWMSVDMKPYRLGGKADRIDRFGNIYIIIDYKTGKVESGELNITDFDHFENPGKSEKSFQMMHYAYLLYHFLEHKPDQIIPGIISMRTPEQGHFSVKLPEGMDMFTDGLRRFEALLFGLLDELFNPDIPFTQTDDLKICGKCPYAPICIR
ncbi:MAG TPA: PD-(D/E)XK nuclease family protein [Bacteroidales bacterium]|nr:PD-(D/E)XK nuclease family protein [Bacteroidales bacterium]HSA43361.1 PD-(D/E)XK nuclease family protein [Bacteroidales bacterium]